MIIAPKDALRVRGCALFLVRTLSDFAREKGDVYA